MNLLSKVAFFTMLLLSFCVGEASATCSSSLPYTFVSTSPLSYVTTNANNNFLLACVTAIDHTQIGTGGIFASQIIPTSGSQATFGGSQTYTFPAGVTLTGTLSGVGASLSGNVGVGQLTSSGSVIGTGINGTGLTISGGGAIGSTLTTHGISDSNGITSTGPINAGGLGAYNASTQGTVNFGSSNTGRLDFNTTSTGNFYLNNGLVINGGETLSSTLFAPQANITTINSTTLNNSGSLSSGPISATGAITTSSFISGSNLDTAYSANQGTVNFGSSNAAEIDYNTANANVFSVSAPLYVNGILQSNGITTIGALNGTTAGFSGQVNANVFSAPTVAGFVSGTGAQILPTYFNGSPITAQAAAHNEYFTGLTANGSGIVSVTFGKPFSVSPHCSIGIVSASAPNVIPFFTTLTTSGFSFTGNAGFGYTAGCTAY